MRLQLGALMHAVVGFEVFPQPGLFAPRSRVVEVGRGAGASRSGERLVLDRVDGYVDDGVHGVPGPT